MLDGVKDGLLENPTRCTFDPKEIECKSGDGPNCLTTAQVEAARKIYAGPTNPRTNEKIWSPLYRGSELDWSFFTDIGGSDRDRDERAARRDSQSDPSWDYRTTPVDFDRDVALADRSDIARVNASNPDISEYVRRGGKLILSGGWNNALVPAGAVAGLLQSRRATIGAENTQRSVRLYMVPGHDRMQRRPGHRHLRHAGRHATLDRARPGAERGDRVARRARQSRAHAAAVSLSAGGDVLAAAGARTRRATSSASSLLAIAIGLEPILPRAVPQATKQLCRCSRASPKSAG